MNNPFTCFFISSKRVTLLLSLVLLFVASSCKTQKKINTQLNNNNRCGLDYKNAKTLTANLKANEFCFDKLNAKLNVEATVDSTYNSFSISLRIKKDSIIWMSISKLGIEGARVFITKDSVKIMNRIDNTYFKGDYLYISKLLNIPLDYDVIQSLLTGNSATFYNDDEKLKPGVDNCQYMLGTVRKHKMKKVEERGKDLKESAQTIYMMPETFKIARILFYEFNPDRIFDARFYDYTTVDSAQLFPLKMAYCVKGQRSISIDVTYQKPRLDEEQSFPFKIPDTYEQLSYKEKE
jgi:hypothetical protein